MSKLRRKLAFDAVLTILLVFEMLYQFTGNFLHEAIGAAFFLCIVAHLLLARRWIASTARSVGAKKMNRQKKGLAIMAVLLFIDMLALGASSAIISNTLWNLGFDLSALNPGNIWIPIHSASAYGLCALALAHLAMHWSAIASVFRIEYNPSRRQAIGQCVGAAVSLGAIALGVVGANQVGSIAEALANTGENASANSSAGSANTATSMSGIPARDANAPVRNASSSKSVQRTPKSKTSNPATTEQNNPSESYTDSQPETSSEQYGYVAEEGYEDSSYEEGYSEPSYEESTPSTTATGICPLCPKRCSLSSPRCNKPYAAGLI